MDRREPLLVHISQCGMFLDVTCCVRRRNNCAENGSENDSHVECVRILYRWYDSPRWDLAFSRSLFQASLLPTSVLRITRINYKPDSPLTDIILQRFMPTPSRSIKSSFLSLPHTNPSPGRKLHENRNPFIPLLRSVNDSGQWAVSSLLLQSPS
ncbi:hypothetical protein TNCV_2896181 [Trichonephila clavipes]|nr:hypothetical protein TNCV_2896181 [Trichonephila clavipes]